MPDDVTGKKQNPHRFKPGVSGNPKGRPKGSFKPILYRVPEKDGIAIIDALVRSAKNGSVSAAKLLIENCDGLPTQPVEHSGGIAVTVKHV